MTGFVQEGAISEALAPYAVAPYDGALIGGDSFGVALGAYAQGQAGRFATLGVFHLRKWAGGGWNAGEAIYWDDDNRECTSTASGNTLIGSAWADADADTAEGLVRLNGAAVPLIRLLESYLLIGSAPVLTGDGTVWDDLSFEMTPTRKGALDKPDFDATNNGLLFPNGDPSEIIHLNVQLPHRWREGSVVYPHVHWHQSANQTPVFKLDWRWVNLGEAVPAWSTGYAMSTKVATYTSGTIHQISTNVGGISGSGRTLSSMLQLKFYRDDSAYTGDALVTSFDLHIEVDAMGSNSEMSKA